MTLPFTSLTISDRLRKDYGDVEELATLIKQHGLIQPLVVNKEGDSYVLVAGGRRHAALTLLGTTELHHGVTCDPSRPGFVFASELPEAQRREVELIENCGRKDLDWREMIEAVVDLHRLYSQRAALNNERWTTDQTASLIGYESTFIKRCHQIHKIKDHLSFASCDTITDAVRAMLLLKRDVAVQELASRTFSSITQTIGDSDPFTADAGTYTPTLAPSIQLTPGPKPGYSSSACVECGGSGGQLPINPCTHCSGIGYEPMPRVTIDLSKTLIKGDSIRVILPSMPAGCVDHIITDPPYNIDIEDMTQQSGNTFLNKMTRVAGTHTVEENTNLFSLMMPQLYRVLKDGGFCLLWHDVMCWQQLYSLAESAGFKVQRWPLIGCKPQGGNSMPNTNITKATEQVMVLRKGVATLPAPVALNWFPMPPGSGESNPFAKSYEAWKYLIEAVSFKGQTILDPFAGEGSCPVTCLKEFRNIIAIEKDETHWPYLQKNIQGQFKSLYPNCLFT